MGKGLTRRKVERVTLPRRLARAERRQPYVLHRPVVAWIPAEILPDGSLEVPVGEDLDGDRPTECSKDPELRSDPTLSASVFGSVLPVGHPVPAPACDCGYGGQYRTSGRVVDRFLDRLGHRMRCAALIELWGRAVFEREGMRAQRGRVLAITATEDEIPEREQRVRLAADRSGAGVVRIEAAAPDLELHTEAHRPSHADAVGPHLFKRAVVSRGVRRWRDRDRERDGDRFDHLVLRLALLPGLLVAWGFEALGLPGAATAVALVLCGCGWLLAILWVSLSRASVEGLILPPPGEPDADPPTIPLEEGPGRLGPIPWSSAD